MSNTINTKTLTIALAGNPNCGKTTIFNGLTGATAKVGNWPGVTVERKQGILKAGNSEYNVVDLPGIYSLSAESEDERVARDFLINGSVDIVISIVDATNLERNLYLTTTVIESGLPVVVALNMMDAAEKEGLEINPEKLSEKLGCPVIPLSAVKKDSLSGFKDKLIAEIKKNRRISGAPVKYNIEIEKVVRSWRDKLSTLAGELKISPEFIALNLLEEDEYISLLAAGRIKRKEIDTEIERLESLLNTSVDMAIAEDRYAWITHVCDSSVKRPEQEERSTSGADKILMHRIWGIPIFIGIMYLVFWVTMSIGGAFIDWFDIVFGGFFVDGLGALLSNIGSPDWLTSIIAGGVGGGIQTVSTFVPIIFVMFFMLAILEDSGYMSRAAFVMDRAMKAIGLPGKAFVPMLIGFGCTVPAIMATRTLESKRDRFMTIFMSPFMSCGARLPVYALFTAAFFGTRSGAVVFSIYMFGIVLAVLTGLLLKNSIFKGTYSPFVMELPEYHRPRLGQISKSAWQRLRIYLLRAGKVIILVVLVLAFLNSLGTDGSFGNEDSEKSVLSVVGKTITPVFTPMGIEKENWPATVSLFTGLFAKEAVVGTLNALYVQEAAAEAEADSGEEEGWSVGPIFADAFITLGENLVGILGGLADPFGTGVITGDEVSTGEELETDDSVFTGLRNNFTPVSAYAYLLFILIYFPCVAALGVAIQETGKGYGTLLVSYLTLLAWIVATLFYQIFEGGSPLWIIVSSVLALGIYLSFKVMGKKSMSLSH
ncbi:MAG: Fe(2+) transporter permease subunit FeoB [Spirochaetales bacterium]|nr:Fe(2+) transporter permease subunit FeoB [Spirochaetales bacterium]